MRKVSIMALALAVVAIAAFGIMAASEEGTVRRAGNCDPEGKYAKVEGMVAAGTITQEQADAWKSMFDKKLESGELGKQFSGECGLELGIGDGVRNQKGFMNRAENKTEVSGNRNMHRRGMMGKR